MPINKHVMLSYSTVQQQSLVKTTSFVANWTSQKQTVQQAAVGRKPGGPLYVRSDLSEGACVLQIGSFNITGNTRDWNRPRTPRTVLANSVIYCTKLSAAEKAHWKSTQARVKGQNQTKKQSRQEEQPVKERKRKDATCKNKLQRMRER